MKTNGLKDFKPIPLYMINDRVEKGEIDRQLALMKESGISAFFIHARDGIAEGGFASKKWYDDVAYIIEKGEEYGLNAYLYDEDPYPSGNLGGKIALDCPEFIARELFVEKVEVKDGVATALLGNARPIAAYALKKNGAVELLDDCFGVRRTDFYSSVGNYAYNGYTDILPHRRAATYHPQCCFYAENIEDGAEIYVAYATLCTRINRYGYLADNLNKKSVDYFKEYAYVKQANAIPSEIKGNRHTLIFTDEPVSGGMLPWTESIEPVFIEKKGYSIKDNYYRLILDDDFSQTVRKDYWQVASEMFKENFIENLRDCCKENGLEFMGHLESEESLYYQAIKCVNVYESMWEFDHPGFDVIYVKTSSRNDYRQVFGAKLVTSVAHQRGSERVFCEMFGITPFNFGLDGMKRYCGWTFIMGANTSVPHGFYYGTSGNRKYDAGKSFFFQSPDFAKFPEFVKFADKYGKMLSEHKPTANTLLIAPNWEFAVLSEEKSAELNEKLLSAVKLLTENHIEFDLTDCNYVEKHFGKGKTTVGIKTYDNVVYVSKGSYVMQSVYERLKNTEANLFVFDSEESFDIKRLKELSVYTELKTVKGDEKDVLTFRKRNSEGDCVFLFNNVAENTVIKLRTDGQTAIYDFDGDSWLGVNVENGYAELSLEGYGFYAVKISDIVQTAGRYLIKSYESKDVSYETQAQWTYMPPVEVKAVINKYDVTVRNCDKTEKILNVNSGLLREIYSADNERILIDALHDSSKIVKNYPVKAEFISEFNADGATKMLFETETFSGEAKIFLNGKEIKREEIERKLIYDIKNLQADVSGLIKQGKNELRIEYEKATERDGITGEIYFY